MEISVIMPICNVLDSQYDCRLRGLKYVVNEFLLKQKNIKLEIILVEQIVNKANRTYKGNIKGIKVITARHKVYIKNWLFNIGVRNSKYDNLILMEIDIFPWDKNENYLYGLVKYAKSKNLKWCFGWDRLARLTEEETERYVKDSSWFGRPKTEKKTAPRRGASEGGIVYFGKSFWNNKFSGANELFCGKGGNGNDNEIAYRARKITNTYKTYKKTIVHLWHPKTKWDNRLHNYNFKLLVKTYAGANMQGMLNANKDKLGRIKGPFKL